MIKQFTIITKDGSKWLRPVNPHEKHLVDEFGLFRNPDHVTFGLNNPDIPYIGSHPEGTVLSEEQVAPVAQYQTTEFGSLTWYTADDEDEINRWRERNPDGFKTRTDYTDAEPQCPECGKYCSCPEEDLYDAVADYRINHPEESHDRHVRPFNTQNVRPLVNQLVGEEISFSRFVEILNEIANGDQKII